MSRGDAEAVAKQPHGIQFRPDPPAPQTVESRLAKLEARVEQLEARVEQLEARPVAAFGKRFDPVKSKQASEPRTPEAE